MKKVLTCMLSACVLLGGALAFTACSNDDFVFADSWQMIAFSTMDSMADNKAVVSRGISYKDGRETITYNPAVKIEGDFKKKMVSTTAKFTIEINGSNVENETNLVQKKVTSSDNAVTYNAYNMATALDLYAFGENFIYAAKVGNTSKTHMYRGLFMRATAAVSPMDSVSAIMKDGAVSLDGLAGKYKSTALLDSKDDAVFSVEKSKNALTVAKSGDSVTFADATATWTVKSAAYSNYFPGVEVMLENGSDKACIVILETAKKSVSYIRVDAEATDKVMFYGVLVK